MQELIARFHTKANARFYLEHSGANYEEYEAEDYAYQDALEQAAKQMDIGLKIQFVERKYISNFIFADNELLVVIGQDGLVANVAKYAHDRPIIGVNPDPARIDGVLVPVSVGNLRASINEAISNGRSLVHVTLAEAKLNDGQRLLAFNDFFIGAQSHISARYHVQYGAQEEDQSSSGIIVSTGVGSTGWLSSLFNMASGMNRMMGREALNPMRLSWSSQELVFVVREPFISKHSAANVSGGILKAGQSLTLESRMPAGGTIFSDGIESDFLLFNSGSIAKIQKAKEKALIYMPERIEARIRHQDSHATIAPAFGERSCISKTLE
jgi:hypothetical protein